MTTRHGDDAAMRNFARRFLVSPPIFLCVLCAFAFNVFPQTDELNFLASQIARGSDEQKRDALARLRNLETAAASRVAVPALKDSSEIVRATAAGSVIFLPPDEAAAVLVPLLADKKPFVRREAADALGKTGDASAVNPLVQILRKDKVLEVRNAAVIALGAIGDAAAIPELLKILQRKYAAKEEFARRSAARSVGQIARIIQTGKRQVVTPESFLPDRFKRIETASRRNLADDDAAFRAAMPVLIQTLESERESADAKREAAFALGEIGSGAAIVVLQANLNGEDYYLTEICREALGKISTVPDNQPKTMPLNPVQK